MATIPHGHPSDMWLGEMSDKMQSYDEVRSVGICSPACGSVSLCVWEELNKETGRDHCHSHWLISQTTCPEGMHVGTQLPCFTAIVGDGGWATGCRAHIAIPKSQITPQRCLDIWRQNWLCNFQNPVQNTNVGLLLKITENIKTTTTEQ